MRARAAAASAGVPDRGLTIRATVAVCILSVLELRGPSSGKS